MANDPTTHTQPIREFPVTQALIAQLVDPDLSVRRRAALTLGASGDPAAAPALVARLGAEENAGVREDVTWATVQLIDAALPQVLRLLASDQPAERRQAAHILSKVADPAHAPHVIPLVADAHSDVAIKAYRAAANTGSPTVVAPLAERLGDGDALQRDALTNAFATLGGLGIAALIRALTDPDPAVREHAADALGHLGTPDADAAAPALLGLVADPEPTVRVAAVAALGQLGDSADAALAEIASGTGTQAALAVRLLALRTASSV